MSFFQLIAVITASFQVIREETFQSTFSNDEYVDASSYPCSLLIDVAVSLRSTRRKLW